MPSRCAGQGTEGPGDGQAAVPRPGCGGPAGAPVGFGNEFMKRNTTVMTWNLMHLARMLRDAGGIPNEGNDRNAWNAGCWFDHENPEHRP